MKPFIGLKKLWYGEPASDNTALTLAAARALCTQQVLNVHNGTWGYSQNDPDTTDYVNELTGKPYYRDMNSLGEKTITFTLGEYEFATRKALQGGEVDTTNKSWIAPSQPVIIYKSILAETKTGNFIFFPNASITTKVDTQDKNLGLGVTAQAMESLIVETKSGQKVDEVWFEAATAAASGK